MFKQSTSLFRIICVQSQSLPRRKTLRWYELVAPCSGTSWTCPFFFFATGKGNPSADFAPLVRNGANIQRQRHSTRHTNNPVVEQPRAQMVVLRGMFASEVLSAKRLLASLRSAERAPQEAIRTYVLFKYPLGNVNVLVHTLPSLAIAQGAAHFTVNESGITQSRLDCFVGHGGEGSGRGTLFFRCGRARKLALGVRTFVLTRFLRCMCAP